MNNIRQFEFSSTYEMADLIDQSVGNEIEMWNYDEDFFINAATSFSKDTILHQYILTTAMNYHHRDFRKNGDEIDLDKWYLLFREYGIRIKKKSRKIDCDLWFENNEEAFLELFSLMAEEVFYLMFGNRNFLCKFNQLISITVQNTKFPATFLTAKGTIKRKHIPEWVRTAVYHRDKGRCVFCHTDLTNLINTITQKNFDHIVPLDLHGTNDPCNIQLLCEKCNKRKSNASGKTSKIYIPWWPE